MSCNGSLYTIHNLFVVNLKKIVLKEPYLSELPVVPPDLARSPCDSQDQRARTGTNPGTQGDLQKDTHIQHIQHHLQVLLAGLTITLEVYLGKVLKLNVHQIFDLMRFSKVYVC